MKLINQSTQNLIIDGLMEAKSYSEKLVGLMGRGTLPANEGLWLKRCNAIHTWFMRFPIDCVFVDNKLRVVRVNHAVGPWRLCGPVLRASSVIELLGSTVGNRISVGDQLHVDA